MTEKPPKLPYRESVGIMLINKRGRVWVGRRVPKWQEDTSDYIWQMPQGGIIMGEKPSHAALRELKEEVGTDNVKILGKSADWLSYDLPDELLGVALGGRYCGHKYKWFAMRYLGADDEIDISGKDRNKAEFDDWRWVHVRKIEDLGISFKENVYHKVIKEFGQLVKRPARKKVRKCA